MSNTADLFAAFGMTKATRGRQGLDASTVANFDRITKASAKPKTVGDTVAFIITPDMLKIGKDGRNASPETVRLYAKQWVEGRTSKSGEILYPAHNGWTFAGSSTDGSVMLTRPKAKQ